MTPKYSVSIHAVLMSDIDDYQKRTVLDEAARVYRFDSQQEAEAFLSQITRQQEAA